MIRLKLCRYRNNLYAESRIIPSWTMGLPGSLLESMLNGYPAEGYSRGFDGVGCSPAGRTVRGGSGTP